MLRLLAASAAALLVLAACAEEAPGGPEREETPSTTAEPTPSGSASPPSAEEPSQTAEPPASIPLTTKGLARGAPPAVDVLVAADADDPAGTWSLARATGEVVELSVERPFGFAVVGGAILVLVEDGDGAAVASLDGTGGEVTREESRGYRLAVSANRNMAAWLAPDGSVRFVEAGRDGVFDLPRVPGAVEMGAMLGYDTCFEAESDVGGCTAFVDVEEPRRAWTTSSHGIVDVAGPMLSVADAAQGGRVLGLVSVDDQGSCGGLFEGPTEPAWQTCEHTLTSFSPSGRRVLGTDAYLDGLGQRSVAFLDARDGQRLREFTSKGHGPTVLQTAWEGEDHVLAVVFERGRWSVVRLGVDGSAEVALGPVAGSDLDRPFVLPED
jgi:hypothetical protein